MDDFNFWDFCGILVVVGFFAMIGYAFGSMNGHNDGYKAGCIDGSNKVHDVILIENKLKCMSVEKIKTIK